jgi:hypothetical protein
MMVGLPAIGFVEEPSLLPLLIYFNRLALKLAPMINDPVTRAINHPVGHVTDALLHWWYRQSLEDDQGLSTEIRAVFTELCDTQIAKFQHGRILLAAHVVVLFRVDRDWATQYLLPLFDWQRSATDALLAWQGFLWSPRLYRPLMEVLKPAFLETATHYETLGAFNGQYAAFLTFAALDPSDTFTKVELANATRVLPADGLHEAARALVRALESAGDQSADYWKNRVKVYLHFIWPKTRDKISPAIVEDFGRLCVAARDAFPDALELLGPWLEPLEHPDFLVHQLDRAQLCSKFPGRSLEFLYLVMGEQARWIPNNLKDCLKAISSNEPELKEDPRYKRLTLYLPQS